MTWTDEDEMRYQIEFDRMREEESVEAYYDEQYEKFLESQK